MSEGGANRLSDSIHSSHRSNRVLRSLAWSCGSCEASRRSPGTATSRAPPRSCTSPSRRCRIRSAGSRRSSASPLFERTSRRVTPTEAGDAIAARARRVLAEVDGAREEVDELRGVLRGRIWIGALLPAGDLDVPGLLARFSQAHPASRSACARASPPTCSPASPTTSSTPPSACSPATSPTSSRSSGSSDDEVVAAFAPAAPRRPPSASPTSRGARSSRRAADRRSPSVAGAALRRRRRAAPPRPRERRPVPAALAGRARVRRGDPPALAHPPRGTAVEVRSLDPPVDLPVALVWRRERHPSPAARTSSTSSASVWPRRDSRQRRALVTVLLRLSRRCITSSPT